MSQLGLHPKPEVLFLCLAKEKVPKKKGDPAFAPLRCAAGCLKYLKLEREKKNSPFFGPTAQNGARTAFFLNPLQL
jgi:hypothetical protein